MKGHCRLGRPERRSRWWRKFAGVVGKRSRQTWLVSGFSPRIDCVRTSQKVRKLPLPWWWSNFRDSLSQCSWQKRVLWFTLIYKIEIDWWYEDSSLYEKEIELLLFFKSILWFLGYNDNNSQYLLNILCVPDTVLSQRA